MKLRTAIGAATLAGALTLGSAVPAGAQESAELGPRACAAARETLRDLRGLDRRLNREVRRLEAAITRAENAGRDKLARRLQARQDRIEARQDSVQAKVAALRERIGDRCVTGDAPAS